MNSDNQNQIAYFVLPDFLALTRNKIIIDIINNFPDIVRDNFKIYSFYGTFPKAIWNGGRVCFGICFPSLAKAIQKSQGHLTPAAIVRLIKAIKKPKVLDLGLIGVLPEYQMKGVSSAIISEVMKMLTEGGIEYCETNLNLETNDGIQNQWKSFDSVLHKRRRCFVKKICTHGINNIRYLYSFNYS